MMVQTISHVSPEHWLSPFATYWQSLVKLRGNMATVHHSIIVLGWFCKETSRKYRIVFVIASQLTKKLNYTIIYLQMPETSPYGAPTEGYSPFQQFRHHSLSIPGNTGLLIHRGRQPPLPIIFLPVNTIPLTIPLLISDPSKSHRINDTKSRIQVDSAHKWTRSQPGYQGRLLPM